MGKKNENLPTNWASCRQQIFETSLSCAAVREHTCSRCAANQSVIKCLACVDPYLCSACANQVHEKYPLHDRKGCYHGYYRALAPKSSICFDGKLVTIRKSILCTVLYIIMNTLYFV